MGVGDQRYALDASPPGKTRLPLYRWLGWPQDLCGKFHPQRDSIPGSSNPWRIAVLSMLSRPTVAHVTTCEHAYFWALFIIIIYHRNVDCFSYVIRKKIIMIRTVVLVFFAIFSSYNVILDLSFAAVEMKRIL